MILESGTTLVFNLTAAQASANSLQVTVSWADHCRANAQFLPGTAYSLSSGISRVVAASMPSSGTQRQIKEITIYNADSSTATMNWIKLNSDVTYTHQVLGISSGNLARYDPDGGWNSLNSSGFAMLQISYTSISTTQIAGDWTSGISSSLGTFSQVSCQWLIGRSLVPDGTALAPSEAYSSETSLGMYRSANSTLRQSYGTFWPTTVWIDSGLSMIGSTGSFSGVNVASTISCSGLTVSSIATVSRLSSNLTVISQDVWASGISIGGTAGAGSRIVAMSSLSTTIPAWVIRGSATSFRTISWADVQNGDCIQWGILGAATASSLSSGLVPHSHSTIAGRFEFRLSNVSTLVQNQSAKTWFFVRITPF